MKDFINIEKKKEKESLFEKQTTNLWLVVAASISLIAASAFWIIFISNVGCNCVYIMPNTLSVPFAVLFTVLTLVIIALDEMYKRLTIIEYSRVFKKKKKKSEIVS